MSPDWQKERKVLFKQLLKPFPRLVRYCIYVLFSSTFLTIITIITSLLFQPTSIDYTVSNGTNQNAGSNSGPIAQVTNSTNVNVNIQAAGSESGVANSSSDPAVEESGIVKGVSRRVIDGWLYDFDIWKPLGLFYSDPYNEKAICPALTKNFLEGSELFNPEFIPPDFTFQLVFTPQSPSRLNTSIVYEDVFRCIIGDNNYKRIDCQQYNFFRRPGEPLWLSLEEVNNNIKKPWINKYHGIEPQSDIFAVVESTSHLDSGFLEVDLSVRYSSDDASITNYLTNNYKYYIDTKKISLDILSRIGIGLLDSSQDRDVCAELIRYKLDY